MQPDLDDLTPEEAAFLERVAAGGADIAERLAAGLCAGCGREAPAPESFFCAGCRAVIPAGLSRIAGDLAEHGVQLLTEWLFR